MAQTRRTQDEERHWRCPKCGAFDGPIALGFSVHQPTVKKIVAWLRGQAPLPYPMTDVYGVVARDIKREFGA